MTATSSLRRPYEPNDSDFGFTMTEFLRDRTTLSQRSTELLDECESICYSILSTPIYEGDLGVTAFCDALGAEIACRF